MESISSNGNPRVKRQLPRIIQLFWKYLPNDNYDKFGKLSRLKLFRTTLSDALFSGPPLLPLVFIFNDSLVSRLMREVLGRLDTYQTEEDKTVIAAQGMEIWNSLRSRMHSEIHFHICEPGETRWTTEAAINEYFGPEVKFDEGESPDLSDDERFDSYHKSVFCVFAAPGETVDIDMREDLLYQPMDFHHSRDVDFEAEFDLVTSRLQVLLFKQWLQRFVKPLEFYRRDPGYHDQEQD